MVSQSTIVRSRRTSSKFCGGAIASQLRWSKCRMRTSQIPRTGVSKPKTVGRQLNRNVVRAVSIFSSSASMSVLFQEFLLLSYQGRWGERGVSPRARFTFLVQILLYSNRWVLSVSFRSFHYHKTTQSFRPFDLFSKELFFLPSCGSLYLEEIFRGTRSHWAGDSHSILYQRVWIREILSAFLLTNV
jgi:hypothetical protein